MSDTPKIRLYKALTKDGPFDWAKAKAQMAKNETPVTITAVWLLRANHDHVEVRVERDGKWYRAIREHIDGPFSHIAEGNGADGWEEVIP